MKHWILVGILFIFFGVAMIAYYDSFVKPEREAKELIIEGKMSFERGTKESLNKAIDTFTKVVARYPKTDSALDAYYHIAQSYEKLNLNRLAYLKYVYILKSGEEIPGEMLDEIKARIARLKIMKRYDEEGIHQLMTALNYSDNKDFRSRVYTELGHTYLKRGEVKRSGRMFDLAISENGNNEEAIIGKARYYKRMGQDMQAYNLYDHFLKYYANFSNYTDDVNSSYIKQLYDSGLNSYRKGSYFPAIEYFQRYLRNFPNTERSENSLYWIGECYFSLKRYDSAISYFRKTLSNNYYHKDQDARIKIGYSFFMAKNFDLAAKEFQAYIDQYPNGRHINRAKEWKDMSRKEMLYKYRKNSPDENINNSSTEESSDTGRSGPVYKQESPRTVQTGFDRLDYDENYEDSDDKYENVAEI
jgi:TolA-binding protein